MNGKYIYLIQKVIVIGCTAIQSNLKNMYTFKKRLKWIHNNKYDCTSETVKTMFKVNSSSKTFWICVSVLWIHKGYYVVQNGI